MRHSLITAVAVGAGVLLTAHPGSAAYEPRVVADFVSVSSQLRDGVFLISVTCDARAGLGAVATSVRCTLSTGQSDTKALPGPVAVTNVTTVTTTRPVTACASGQALFVDGELVTAVPYCRTVVPPSL